jgi:hypothetical protein
VNRVVDVFDPGKVRTDGPRHETHAFPPRLVLPPYHTVRSYRTTCAAVPHAGATTGALADGRDAAFMAEMRLSI